MGFAMKTESDHETSVSIRSSLKSKIELDKLLIDKTKSQWLKDKIRDDRLIQAIEMTDKEWIAIPREEYNAELSGFQIQWGKATNEQKEMIRELQKAGVLVEMATILGKFVNDYAIEWKKEKAEKGEMVQTQHVDTIRFEDVYKVVEFFHFRNGIELTQTRNAGTIQLIGKHNIGTNYSKAVTEIFRELCRRSQEMKIVNADNFASGYVITLSLSDV